MKGLFSFLALTLILLAVGCYGFEHQRSLDGSPSVCVLASGVVGEVVAELLSEAGASVHLWHRQEHRASLVPGCVPHVSVQSAVEECDVLISALRTHLAESSDVLGHIDLANKIWVDLSASNAETARKHHRLAQEKHAIFVDCALLGTPSLLGSAEAVILASGEHVHAVEPILHVLGNLVDVGPEIERASALDAALLAYFDGALSGWAHALAVLKKENIPATELERFFDGILPALHGILRTTTSLVASGDANLAARIQLSADTVIGWAKERGIVHSFFDSITALDDDHAHLGPAAAILDAKLKPAHLHEHGHDEL